MCGIFGLVSRSGALDAKAEDLLDALFRLSESRGKEAAGLAGITGNRIRVLKSPVPSSLLAKTREYVDYVSEVVQLPRVAVIGHSRLVTNGAQTEHTNNQPVSVDDLVGIHNGIIVNDEDLWRAHPELTRTSEVDTEVLLRLVRKHAARDGSFIGGVRRAFGEIDGVANVAMFATELDQLTLATNNGSIYYVADRQGGWFAFASERYILEKALERTHLVQRASAVVQLAAGAGLLVDLSTTDVTPFSLAGGDVVEKNGVHRTITVDAPLPVPPSVRAAPRRPDSSDTAPAWFLDELEKNREAIARLRRCVRCVQPETVPFVGLDADGVCVDCRHHQPIVAKGVDELVRVLEPHRTRDGRPEVLVPLSGGRDSCYMLHYLTRELGVKAIAYTYDWGMVTDLARRNASRLCGKLGVEHIIVSADIAKKREYIRMNVDAWLRAPDLGIVPLFMAGDKQYFHHAEQLQRRTGVKFQIWGNNRLERSDFKTGFCGFDRAGYHDNSLFHLGPLQNARLVGYYLRAFAKNRGFINRSIPDTAFSYFLYFLGQPTYLDFYDFVPWDEDVVVKTIIDEYGWELATDTTSTWRIGDGTAAFYNYIYWTAAGFTESDTFRSGQVRAGTRTREHAQRVVDEENRPRYESLAWYCRTIGVDLDHALRAINAIPKLYPTA
jgi:glutamine---fructose-6-phosphate transaminase (isomerizing)